MRKLLPNLGCFILFILFLPLVVIVIGPLLVLAALRGRQPAGPITLDTVRYGPAGRVGTFLLGLAIWLLIWSSLAWLAIVNGLPAPTMADISSNLLPTETPTAPVATPTPLPPTPTPSPSLTLVPTSTPTPLPPTATPTTPSPTDTPTPTVTATSTATPTELFNETLATNTPTPAPTVLNTSTPTPAEPPEANGSVTPGPTLAVPPSELPLAERQAIITTVEDGNSLLREAIVDASEENLQNLSAIWQDDALPVARDFAIKLYESYTKPFVVEFEYLKIPSINPDRNQIGEIVVTSRERWSYGGPTTTQEEAFEFIYSLSQIEGRWVITDYTYRNLPLPTPAQTSIPTSTRSPTPASTPPEQQ